MGLFKRKEKDLEAEYQEEKYLEEDLYLYLNKYLDDEDRAEYASDAVYNLDGFVGISFHTFQMQNPCYMQDLRPRMTLLSECYDMISRKRYARLRKNVRHLEMVHRLGYGMLMRHAMEAISVDLYGLCGGTPGKETVHERLEAIKGRTVPCRRGDTSKNLYDDRKDRILREALNFTNEIAHPHVIGRDHTYEDLCRFYENQFRDVIAEHIQGTKRRGIRRYLSAMQKRLDHFNFKDKITRMLVRGCLTRQLVECAVNRWCYHYGLVPTDASTSTMQIKLSERLKELAKLAGRRKHKKFHKGSFMLTQDVISPLYKLKNMSNQLMHVAPMTFLLLYDLRSNGLALALNSYMVLAECSPESIDVKTDEKCLRKKFTITMLLSGFFGWTGAHHFYAGNIGFGLLYLFTYMCVTYLKFDPRIILELEGPSVLTFFYLAAPFVALSRLHGSDFFSRKWGKMDFDHVGGFRKFLHFVLSAAHLVLLLIFYLR